MITAQEMATQTGWPLETWKAAEAELGRWWPALQRQVAEVSGVTGTPPDTVALAFATLTDTPSTTPGS